MGERATGGDILYVVPALKDLNEESEQQGAEGKEDYRFIFTLSVLL